MDGEGRREGVDGGSLEGEREAGSLARGAGRVRGRRELGSGREVQPGWKVW